MGKFSVYCFSLLGFRTLQQTSSKQASRQASREEQLTVRVWRRRRIKITIHRVYNNHHHFVSTQSFINVTRRQTIPRRCLMLLLLFLCLVFGGVACLSSYFLE